MRWLIPHPCMGWRVSVLSTRRSSVPRSTSVGVVSIGLSYRLSTEDWASPVGSQEECYAICSPRSTSTSWQRHSALSHAAARTPPFELSSGTRKPARQPVHTVNAFIILLMVATLVAALSRRIHIPYTVALVAVGLALGTFGTFHAPPLDKELLFAVFLPGLLFEAAYHLKSDEFWRNKFAIIVLAVPGVVVAIALTALLVLGAASAGWLPDVGWRQALIFAALIAATDPVAVVALFRELGVDRRLQVLVEGESLLNDGTAVVIFTLALAVATGGTDSIPSPLYLIGQFALMAGGGLAVGILSAFGITWCMRRVDDSATEIT